MNTTPVEIEVSDDENTTQPDRTESPLRQTEKLGFIGGNIGAGGLVCGGNDGFIYYRSENDFWKLYKARPDGSEKIKVSERMPDNINVLGDWVYFLDYQDGFSIYRVRANGTDETKLIDGYCGNLYVAESGMYFDKRNEQNIAQIYHADLDGGNMTLLYQDASLMYYYKGMIYLGAGQLGVYNIKTGEESILAETYVHNVSVDDNGIYYWAVDEGEFRYMGLDGTNESVILKGGNFFNYCSGKLYYIGIDENSNGPCHVVNQLNIASNVTTTHYEEVNEYFNAHGEWVGVTFKQFNDHPETIDPELMKQNEQGEIEIGYSESVMNVYVSGEHLFMRAALRKSLIQSGKLDCIAKLDGGVVIWD